MTRLRQFLRRTQGNVAVIVALAAVPMLAATGMGIDYGIAADLQTKLNSYADAAALAAVTPAMMAQSDSTAQTAAANTFNSQAQALSNVTYSSSNLTVTVATTSGGVRTATVSYKASYNNIFPNIVGLATIGLNGTSSAKGGLAPNIDFYLLLDSSPSMAIGATQTDINTLMAHTTGQDSPNGCGFACHESDPQGDGLSQDNYTVARNLGLTLRIDLLRQAAQNLISSAYTKESTTKASYRMAIYTFDVNFNTIQTLTSSIGTSSTAYNAAGTIDMPIVYKNNWLTPTNNNSDADTNYTNAMTSINAKMPNPGSGTNNTGDTPQEVLFLVTDGVEDEMVSGSRVQSLMNPSYCTTIKNRGIRIAVLYTEYLPLPTDPFYMGSGYSENSAVNTFQANIASNLQSCASSGLFYQVQTGGDISGALASLFQAAVQSAYLSQ